MANLAEDRQTELFGQPGRRYAFGIAEAVTAYLGLLAFINAEGYYDPDAPVYCPGVVEDFPTGGNRGVNTTGADGDEKIVVASEERRLLDLHGSDTPTDADLGRPVFAVDNHTITLQPFHLTAARPFCGLFAGVEREQGRVDLTTRRSPSPLELGDYNRAPVQTLAAATVVVVNAYQQLYPVVGTGGATTLTADLPDGKFVGQEIELEGTHDTNAVVLSSAISNIKLAGGVSLTLAANCAWRGRWNGTTWNEVTRSLNS